MCTQLRSHHWRNFRQTTRATIDSTGWCTSPQTPDQMNEATNEHLLFGIPKHPRCCTISGRRIRRDSQTGCSGRAETLHRGLPALFFERVHDASHRSEPARDGPPLKEPKRATRRQTWMSGKRANIRSDKVCGGQVYAPVKRCASWRGCLYIGHTDRCSRTRPPLPPFGQGVCPLFDERPTTPNASVDNVGTQKQ